MISRILLLRIQEHFNVVGPNLSERLKALQNV